MSWYDDDFYQEPSEFEEQIAALKESLMNAIKDEHKAEIARLQQENEELQKVKRDWNNLQSEYAGKVRALSYEKDNLKRQVRNERLTELMQDFNIIAYRATTNRLAQPKCDKCDDYRKIKFFSPSGKVMSEECECSVGIKVFEPEEMQVAEFGISRDKNSMMAWYQRRYSDSDHYSSTQYAEHIYKPGTSYEELGNYYSVFFREEGDCQRYCDWLNEQEAAKKKES